MKRGYGLIIAIFLILTQFNLHEACAQSDLQSKVQSIQVEVPSSWAIDEIHSLSIYNFIDTHMYQKPQKPITKDEMYRIGVQLYEKLTAAEIEIDSTVVFKDNPIRTKAYTINLLHDESLNDNFNEPANRLQVIDILYQVINKAQPDLGYDMDDKLDFKDAKDIPNQNIDMVKYFIGKGVLRGNPNKTLNLMSLCTREEMFAFLNRTYELVMQETDATSKGFFWKVEGGTSQVYLMGSIHAADSRIYPMNNDIIKAYTLADYLVVEANLLNNNSEGIAYMQQKMFYTDNNTLEDNISEQTYQMFLEKIKPYGIPEESYIRFKPWSAALVLQNLEMAQNDYSAGLGVDLYFMTKAIGRKELIEIEGLKLQVNLFESFTPELQEQFLLSTLDGDEQSDNIEVMEALLNAWKQGDVHELEDILKLEEQSSENEFTQQFWIMRNHNMVNKIQTYLTDDTNKTYFVVVGAGHMVGDTGIINQLQDKDYTVEQILD